jgi:Zn-dependent protease
MPEATDILGTSSCAACGTELAPYLLSCPNCRRLVHADRLKQLADEAALAEQQGDATAALAAWQEALGLLPPASRQFEVIAAKVAALGRQVDAAPAGTMRPAPTAPGPSSKRWGGLAGLGSLVLLALTKGKFLLLGLTKASTFFSMALALGVYWAAFGWQFALGLVLSIYVHEMGHVAALRRYGIRAGAPMFIPGLGAVIRLRQTLTDPRQDARVGLAGPLWGLAAALVTYAVYLATGRPIWGAIAHVGAWINLFNLIPIGPLDGGRGFHALTRSQRWTAVLAIGLAFSLTGEGLLILLLLGGIAQAAAARPATEPDRVGLLHYAFLVATLSALTLIHVPLPSS